jgi:pimeloyl-ACP methyl ester carboxylesterase
VDEDQFHEAPGTKQFWCRARATSAYCAYLCKTAHSASRSAKLSIFGARMADVRYSISPLLGKLMQPLLLKGMFAPLPVPASFAKGSTPDMSIRPGQIRAESQDGVAMIPGAMAMRHHYQELTMPVVIMAGTEDRVVNVKQPRRLHAQIQHSILRLVPGVGHMLHYAVPEAVAEAIEGAGGLGTTLRNTRQGSYTASAA